MNGYKVTYLALCCWMSFTAVIMANHWDGHPLTGMTANASTLSPAFPARLHQTSDPVVHLVKNNSRAFQVKNASGPVGTAIPLKIQLPFNSATKSGGGSQYTFLMFRGLPKGFKLSSGISTKNAYIVSVEKYKNILILPTRNYKGEFPLRVLLHKANNTPPIERFAVISIGVNDTQEQNIPASSGTYNTAAQSTEIAKPKVSPENEAASLAHGQSFIESGNIAFARLVFEDLAMQGSARGAFALGQTYDPAFFMKRKVVGLKPDIKTAKKWYRKAAKMGSQSAVNRLNIIEGEGY